MQLLLIDTDRDASAWLADRLSGSGFRSVYAATAAEAIARDLLSKSAAILADAGPENQSGAITVRQLREVGAAQPLVVLSSRNDWREKVDCLDTGADDFLVRPVRSEEIAARLRVIMRRCAGTASDKVRIGSVELDLKAMCAWRDGACLQLTRNEFRLLRLLMLNPGQALGQSLIREQLYFDDASRSDNAVEVLIGRLRRKVGAERIRTIRGAGYRFVAEPDLERRGAIVPESCQADHELEHAHWSI